MEQGPVLESRGYAIGPVAAIAGQTRLAVSVEGTQVCLLLWTLRTCALEGAFCFTYYHARKPTCSTCI